GPLLTPSPRKAGLAYSRNFRHGANSLRRQCGALPLDGGGLGGGESCRKDQSRRAAERYVIVGWSVFGSITPTLTRPHQGGGNALAICEHRRRAVRESGSLAVRDLPAMIRHSCWQANGRERIVSCAREARNHARRHAHAS